jgi:hypothetical protein
MASFSRNYRVAPQEREFLCFHIIREAFVHTGNDRRQKMRWMLAIKLDDDGNSGGSSSNSCNRTTGTASEILGPTPIEGQQTEESIGISREF